MNAVAVADDFYCLMKERERESKRAKDEKIHGGNYILLFVCVCVQMHSLINDQGEKRQQPLEVDLDLLQILQF